MGLSVCFSWRMHETIVDKEIFEKVQEMKKAHSKKT